MADASVKGGKRRGLATLNAGRAVRAWGSTDHRWRPLNPTQAEKVTRKQQSRPKGAQRGTVSSCTIEDNRAITADRWNCL